MIHVVAVIKAKPGERDEILAALRDNTPAVRAEAGCIRYEASIDAEDVGEFQSKFGPDALAVIEAWESVEALRAHTKTPHMATYGARTRPHILERNVYVLSPQQ